MNLSLNASNDKNLLTRYFFVLNKYLIVFLPFALITGPFLPELICFISICYFFYFSILNKDWKYYKNIFFLFICIWSFFLITSSLFSNNILLSLESSLFYIRHGLFAISLWYVIDKDPRIIKIFLFALLLAFSILLIDSFIQYFTGKNILGYPYNPNKARLSSLFGNEWILGNYLSRLMPIVFALTFYVFPKPKKYLFILCIFIIALDVIIYVSGERTAFLNLLFATFLMIIFLNKFQKFRIFTFLISISVVVIISIFNDNLKYRMINKSINQINIFSENYVADHELFARSSISMFFDYPIVGAGPKMYRELCSDERYYYTSKLYHSCSTHPHNTYLQLLAETGSIGFIIISFLYIYLFFLLAKNLYKRFFYNQPFLSDMQICLMISFAVNFFPLIPSMNFFNNWINIIYFLPIGFILHTYYLNKSVKNKSIIR